MDYCDVLSAGLPRKQIERMQRLKKNKAARLVKPRTFYRMTFLVKRIPIYQRVSYQVLLYVWKALQGQAARYIQQLIQVYNPGRLLRCASRDPPLSVHALTRKWARYHYQGWRRTYGISYQRSSGFRGQRFSSNPILKHTYFVNILVTSSGVVVAYFIEMHLEFKRHSCMCLLHSERRGQIATAQRDNILSRPRRTQCSVCIHLFFLINSSQSSNVPVLIILVVL